MSAAASPAFAPQRDAAAQVSSSRPTARAAAGLALIQTALVIVPLVLGRAIGWPASLRLPAAEVLPLMSVAAQEISSLRLVGASQSAGGPFV